MNTYQFSACSLAILAGAVFAQSEPALPPPDVLKKLSVQELMNLQVTSVSKRPEKLSEAASAVQLITGEDILRSGAANLPEALRLAPNLQVARIDSRQWAVSARGFNSTTSNKLLVLIDGRTVYTPLFAGVFWDVQDTLLEDVDRIEVISGPGATLWGANAVNGVINVTSKAAKDTQGLLLIGAAGPELRGLGGVRYGGKLTPDLHYRVYGKFSDRDGAVFPNGQDADNDWHLGQGGFRLDWEATDADLLTLQGDLYGGKISQPGADDIEVGGGNVVGRWSHVISEESDFKVQVYYDRTHRDIPGVFGEDLDTWDLDFQHRFPLGEGHDIVWGLGYRWIQDDVSNTPVLAFLPAQVERQWFSGFVQDEIALVKDRLHLTLGTKIEHNDYTGVEFQPSGRLAWKINERQTLWAAISRAVRTPSRIDRDFYVPGTQPYTVLQGGPDFASEELLAYELGYRLQASPQMSFSLAAFYNDYDKLRSIERINPPASAPLMIGNGLEGEIYGVELTADYRVTDWWRLRAGYTNLQVSLRAKPDSTDASDGSSESHDPNHQFSIRSSFDLPANLALDLAFRYVAEIENQNLPGYGELDLRLAWQASERVEFSIVGRSLLNDHHAEFGAEPQRQEIERSIYGKVIWRF